LQAASRQRIRDDAHVTMDLLLFGAPHQAVHVHPSVVRTCAAHSRLFREMIDAAAAL
jgi:hypothetical protein